MVTIVHTDNKDWSIKKICEYIAGKNDDLEEYGFSSRTIYNYLNDENRKLLGPRGRKMIENNVTEEKFEDFQINVTEDSSTSNTKTLPINYKVKEVVNISNKDKAEDFEVPNITTTTIKTNTETHGTTIDQNERQEEEQRQLIKDQDEYIEQYDELEIRRQMLYNQRQENKYLINEIRNLRNLDSQSVTVSREMEEEEIEDEKIRLSFQNNTKRIADEMGELISYDEDKVIECSEHWDQMKRLFRVS